MENVNHKELELSILRRCEYKVPGSANRSPALFFEKVCKGLISKTVRIKNTVNRFNEK